MDYLRLIPGYVVPIILFRQIAFAYIQDMNIELSQVLDMMIYGILGKIPLKRRKIMSKIWKWLFTNCGYFAVLQVLICLHILLLAWLP